MKQLIIVGAYLMFSGLVIAKEQIYRTDNAVVAYSGIEAKYAEAIARTAEAARAIAVRQFGFDMPETIKITVRCDLRQKVRLFNDGNDRLYLTVRAAEDLSKPSESGVFHIYGICHEIGHLAMYRIIRDHSWVTSDGAEGWAHYLGARIVDGVYTLKKEELWPDRYNYLADGTARVKKQLARPYPSGSLKAVRLWIELGGIVGDKGIVSVFKAWAGTDIDPADPGAAIRKSLLAVKADPRLEQWWNKAETALVFKRPKSGFAAQTAKSRDLAGQPIDLTYDDGRQSGKSSMAGGGHAVRFKIPGDSWYLTEVRIYGSRYGYPAPPKEDFHIWLCDSDFKTIADFPQPYAKFGRGDPRWVGSTLRPTNVPSEFIVCVGFNPTGTKGVYVGYDESGSGNSISGLPGRAGRAFDKGDWMIRVTLDQLKTADALRAVK
ncbi:MAG: hypothetical protein ACYS8Z_20450 [Planctomycetota bacterium]|jgi:RNA polymerase sigma-70 factor (ECF subfamily)